MVTLGWFSEMYMKFPFWGQGLYISGLNRVKKVKFGMLVPI